MKNARSTLFATLLVGGALLVGAPEASAQVYFLPKAGPAVAKEAQANVFGYVKNAWQVSAGQAATDMEAHRRWARGEADATVAGEIDRLTDQVMANVRKLNKDKLVEVFAQLKQGAVTAANKTAGHTLDTHRNWARGQSDDVLRGEIVRIALAGAKAF